MKTKVTAVLLTFILMISLIPYTSSLAAPPNLDSASSWAREAITQAVEKGFVPADIQSNYSSVINRQEFCRMAIKWMEYATAKSIDAVLSERGLSRNPNAFTDTKDTDILAAYALGITSGVGNNQFNPSGQFSREQAAAMIMNTLRALGVDVSNPPPSGFADYLVASSWARNGIDFVRAHGIMQGTGNNNFSPSALYTREQSIMTFNNINHEALLGREQISIADLVSAGIVDVVQADDGSYRVIDGTFTDTLVKSERDAANVLNSVSQLFDGDFYAEPSRITAQRASEGTARAETFYRYSPAINSVPVLGSQIILITNSSGVVQGLFSSYDYHINSVNTSPSIAAAQAENIALQACLKNEVVSSLLDSIAHELGIPREELNLELLSELASKTQLLIYAVDEEKLPALVWEVDIGFKEDKTLDIDNEAYDYSDNDSFNNTGTTLPFISMKYYIYANGSTAGEVLAVISDNMEAWSTTTISADDLLGRTRAVNVQLESDKYRMRDNERNIETYNTNYSRKFKDLWLISTPNLPGKIVSDTVGNDPSMSAVSAHANMALIYDYYKSTLGRSSYDGYGKKIVTSLGYSTKSSASYANAFWSSAVQQFAFGNTGNYEAAIDVVGHEFTHAVNEYINGLVYLNESGALNEAYADIMGSLVENKSGNDRWLIGEDSSGGAIRSMANPSQFNQPNHYSNRYTGADDHGGVHRNSGIFNYAAYLMMTDSRTSSILSETWAQVYYRSLFRLTANANFSDAANAVISSARTQGFTENQIKAIEDAYVTVGIIPPASIVGTWVGSYFATQGETGLTLTVYGDGTAIFDFYNIPGRSNAKAGKYIMSVTLNSTTGEYSLIGKTWIDKPSTYEFVDLYGFVNGSTFSGDVTSTGSTSRNWKFSLQKVNDTELNLPTEIIGTWEGSYTATQGETGLTLTVYSNGTAMFVFYNLPGQNNAKNGKYTMTVSYNGNTGEYSLIGREWITRPSSWEFVSLFGFVEGSSFTGRVNQGSNASWQFNLRKL